jgi:hypothetical protein
MDLVLTNALGHSGTNSKFKAMSNLLDKTMRLAPNRGSLIRALAIAQPNLGGSQVDAVALCRKFSGKVTDVPDYTPDICQIDAAYTYDLGPGIRNNARMALRSTDLNYLEYARRLDWRPGIFRRLDSEILDYLNGEGDTDLDLA